MTINAISEHGTAPIAESPGGGSGAGAENLAKMTLVLKAKLVGDFFNRQIATQKHGLGFFDDQAIVIDVRTHAAHRVFE